ncbi:endoribonuclease Dicer-like [Argiope bruennichi]|uniref:endoribonuclease Dicer-like n=1 Tax=Argiope bruennichi TaxID=94029 RepID=UPI0024947349|nr:endoribonuclease Dicer-like [Argiope bruennichi]XP_055947707.1 endoribonuclease Dicer-like [Argiope bruennichi]XP_055947708.1 endoribonuclease Dicer-like [Argiope bruennichi]XP_055947709.1 endoribonuclease Dicer-like [Argiope bruennichi]
MAAADNNFPSKRFKGMEKEIRDSESFTPRDYQIEILEVAKQRNTIACLGTGTGKTFIAIMLIREYANEVRKPFKEGGKRIFFVVPTIPLVIQQAETIENHTDLAVGRYYKKINVYLWVDEFCKSEVLVMTPEIFKLILEHAFILPRQIKLIILDECHQTLGHHPYRQAMKHFIDLPSSDIPRIFGLTASLLNGKCKPHNLEKNLKDLEKSLRSTIVTVSDATDLLDYGTDPMESVVLYNKYELGGNVILLRIAEKIKEVNNEKIKIEMMHDLTFFDEPLKCLNSLSVVLKNLGPFCAYKAADIYAREVEALLNQPFADNCHRMLNDIHYFLKEVKENCISLDTLSESTKINSMPHKMKRLLDIFLASKRHAMELCGNFPDIKDVPFTENPIKHYQIFKQKQDLKKAANFCSIVFVRERITAYVLYQWLLEIKKKYVELDFLKPEFLIGHGVMYNAESSKFENTQRKKLKDFREKQLNVLVATQVLEEGIDIRQCNLVIRFDLPTNFRCYIQSKGRARAKNSNYVLLVEEKDVFEKFMEDFVDFKRIEKMLQSKCHDHTMPTEEEISAHMADSLIPPYMPKGPDGPRITMSSAISLVNRYCASLPSDMATKLVPQWSIRDIDLDNNQKEYECTLRMPINSPLRQTIVSAPMRGKKLAKMCAALKACQLLNEQGELNENLMPISCLVDDAFAKELGEIEEEDGKGAIPGTKKRRQIYDKHVPVFLKGVKPQPGKHCYLNIINMILEEPLPKILNPRKRPLFDPAKTPRTLALLCSVKLPSVNPFPLFTKSGKVLITITAYGTPFILTDQNIQDIEDFHRFIFSETLWLKEQIEFQPLAAPSSYYICPVIEGKIDWDFIFATKQHPYQRQKLETKDTFERTPFDMEKFSDTVLMRSYKIDACKSELPTFHHVVRICRDMKPTSPFVTDSKYKTFEQYFFTKYNVLIHDLQQPLVETIQMSGLHMWKPLYISPKETFDDKNVSCKTKKKHQNYREYLVPELCIIHPFPSSFFFKVMCLPSILFRLNSLLLAEEIRQVVAREAHIGTVGLSEVWQPFHLETSNKPLIDHLFQIGELRKMPRNEIMPCDIIKDISSNEITSFEVKIDLKTHTGPSPSLLLQALTTKSAGDEFDLERFEIIGDSFLKYSMSVKTYIKYSNFDEGKLTSLRSQLIQNLNLYQKGKKKKLGEYLITTGFNCSKTWLPPCYVVEDHIDEKNLNMKLRKEGNEKDMDLVEESENPLHLYFTKQVISDKCVADSVEALIGCYLLSSGQLGALKFMAWLGVNPFLDNETEFENWPPPPPNPIVCEPGPLIHHRLEFLTNGFNRFEEAIGYTFRNKAYLLQAFTHPSYYVNDITDCYQRLEFLGDSILDYLITRQLFEDPAGHSPGKLTDLRSALVNNINFAILAVKHNYHDFLKIMSPNLFKLVNRFIEVLKKSEQYKFFEIHQYYLEEIECFELEDVDVPKALGDVFESVAGAIYLDSGMSLDAVWKVYYPWIAPIMKHFCKHIPISPVRELYELVKCQKIFGEPVLRNKNTYIEVTLPDGRKYQGVGPNKKIAEKSAAKRALADLKNNSRMDTSE